MLSRGNEGRDILAEDKDRNPLRSDVVRRLADYR